MIHLLTAQTTFEQETASGKFGLLHGRSFPLSLSTWQHQREAELSVVVVIGLVVFLLYNKLGPLPDHSLRELLVLAQSKWSITSSKQFPLQPDCGL